MAIRRVLAAGGYRAETSNADLLAFTLDRPVAAFPRRRAIATMRSAASWSIGRAGRQRAPLVRPGSATSTMSRAAVTYLSGQWR